MTPILGPGELAETKEQREARLKVGNFWTAYKAREAASRVKDHEEVTALIEGLRGRYAPGPLLDAYLGTWEPLELARRREARKKGDKAGKLLVDLSARAGAILSRISRLPIYKPDSHRPEQDDQVKRFRERMAQRGEAATVRAQGQADDDQDGPLPGDDERGDFEPES